MPERRWLILVVIGIAQLMVVLDVTIVNIALPSAQRDLGFSDDDRQWVITAYALAFGSLLLLGGRIGDLFGRKWTFIVGLLGFAGASAVGGAADSFGVLVGARALQGAFGALLAPAALSLLTTTFTEPAERGKAFGIYAAIAGMGGAIGLLLGGALTETLGWRWCLYVSIFFAVPAAIAGARLLEHTPVRSRPRLDVPGALLASSGLFALVFGLARARVRRLGRRRHARVPGRQRGPAGGLRGPRAARRRRRCCRCAWSPTATAARRFLAIGTVSAGLFALFLFLTFYLQNAKGFSAFETGLAFLPLSFSIAPTVGDGQHARAGADRPAPARPDRAADRGARHGPAHADRRRHGLRDARAAVAGADRDRLRPDHRARVRDRHPRRAAARRRRGLGDGQHLPAGRRLDRHGAAEHGRGVRGGLHGRVLVGGGALRRRRAGRVMLLRADTRPALGHGEPAAA